MKTTREILKTVYFDGFNCRLRDETEINNKWYSEEEYKELIEILTNDIIISNLQKEVLQKIDNMLKGDKNGKNK